MRKEKCEKCGMTHGGFHVCVDLSYKAPGEGKIRDPYKAHPNRGRVLGPFTEEHKRRLSESIKASWRRRRMSPPTTP